ncbi:hypothetical protein L873DRAFT_1813885 [Choiromyces venosus 120613-1]|uniref:Uncharacterized protein n=1 Tax=Choiromyces venosus 120613-1 TaxID=1336337 RepID=A0A3N4J962_9PEZI|nr:hypothetical protein L873DRAFT_1813885 [Choiromyces venosus 120613-1]
MARPITRSKNLMPEIQLPGLRFRSLPMCNIAISCSVSLPASEPHSWPIIVIHAGLEKIFFTFFSKIQVRLLRFAAAILGDRQI